MELYIKIFREAAWPVFLMLAIERSLVTFFLNTPKQIEWVRNHWWLHPNAITRYRYPMGVASVLLLHYGYPRVAIWWFAFWMITDLTDGDIARKCGLTSERGASLDPFSDKLMYIPALIYLAWLGELSVLMVSAFVAFDVIGQFTRSFIKNKSANLFGKAKTFLVVCLIVGTTVDMLYGPMPHARIIDPLMGFCVGLAFCSVVFKIIPNYWYANILSIMNLVCGLSGIVLIFLGYDIIYAFALVFLGQFLDLFDGRAAEKWGSTPKGELFDDVADGTSFGGTIGLLVAFSFDSLLLGVLFGALHLIATAYRLVRFIIRKRAAGVEGGVEWFCGMPSPGGALVTGTACLLIPNEILKGALVVITAFLMVSSVPYPHFGRRLLPKIPRTLMVLVLGAFTILLAFAVKWKDYSAPLTVVFFVALIYLVSPIFIKASSDTSTA
ncbi:MAG: CDP-diacylglycerol--glycerol-3-phosphate 3-phosphatidyltransferase [Deltaproteobacteria bacterium]|nr:MAG: CDP-diacylglycerol--glycerol-3-phosphate 3-phosphatidyltransferase [Deltaproteobacteria bacterium]